MFTSILTSISLFFFNDTATTEIYTLSLHDALPISDRPMRFRRCAREGRATASTRGAPCSRPTPRLPPGREALRSEEHTSELQSRLHLVCRLLLEKKKKTTKTQNVSKSHVMSRALHV